MGKHWGNLGYSRGVITYGLSPYEQNAFAGFFTKGLPNLMRRFADKFFVVGIPIMTGIAVISWANSENIRVKRKAHLFPELLDDEDEC